MVSREARWSLLGAAIAALAASGCSDRACIQWSSVDGPCPSPEQALVFMRGSELGVECRAGKVTSVDSEGDYDGHACCYDVTEVDTGFEEDLAVDCVGAVGAGAGPGFSNPGDGVAANSAGTCGDGFCDNSFTEDCSSCPDDCGDCVCGDGLCTGDEFCGSCPRDCGACVCGDGICTLGEDCTACIEDCLCYCGDGSCSAEVEDCSNCASDCGVCSDCRVGRDGCVGCAEVLQSCASDLLCERSLSLFDAVFVCACNACTDQCPGACIAPDVPETMECASCLAASCSMELASCLADVTP